MTSAVITGIGVVAPTGIGACAHWESVLAGASGIRRISSFDPQGYPTTIAGQVGDFNVEDYVEGKVAVQTDRWTWLSLAATRLALADASLDPADQDPYATSVCLAAGSGGNEFGQREMTRLYTKGPKTVGAYQSIAWFYAASTGQASILHGTKGPASVLVSEGAGGLDSLGQARRVVRRGTATVLAGGTEAPLSPYALACTCASGQMTSATDPRDGYKPFDIRAAGAAPGEGGAVLVVEDLEAAQQRDAGRLYGEIAGYAATHDAYHHGNPSPDPTQYARAMHLAVQSAGLTSDDIDLVVADGAGTPVGDALEAAALKMLFGTRTGQVPVTTSQGLVGRLNAGSGALSVATALLSMRAGVVPPVGNLDEPNTAYGLDLVQAPRTVPVEVVLVNARGLGGFNSSMVLRRVRDTTSAGA